MDEHAADPAFRRETADTHPSWRGQSATCRTLPKQRTTAFERTFRQEHVVAGGVAPCEALPAEVSRARGRCGFRLRRLPSRLLAPEALPRPDRLGHHLSRARDDPGWRGQRRRARCDVHAPFTNPPGRACLRETHQATRSRGAAPPTNAAFAGARYARAASHDLPRRRPRSAAPEVPSIDGLPILERAFGPPSTRGWVAIHRLSPTCGLPTGAFSFLVGSTAF